MFDGKCYFVSPSDLKYNWIDSLNYCVNNQSVLISIDSNVYPSRLFKYMKNDYINSVDPFWVNEIISFIM